MPACQRTEPSYAYQHNSHLYIHTATTEIYTLSLHDALPISLERAHRRGRPPRAAARAQSGLPRGLGDGPARRRPRDRKSTRLNSSHTVISYAVFCLKKKNLNTLKDKRISVTFKRLIRPYNQT